MWNLFKSIVCFKIEILLQIRSLLIFSVASVPTQRCSADVLWCAEQDIGVGQGLDPGPRGDGGARPRARPPSAPQRPRHEGEPVEAVGPPVAGVGLVVLTVQAGVTLSVRPGAGHRVLDRLTQIWKQWGRYNKWSTNCSERRRVHNMIVNTQASLRQCQCQGQLEPKYVTNRGHMASPYSLHWLHSWYGCIYDLDLNATKQLTLEFRLLLGNK